MGREAALELTLSRTRISPFLRFVLLDTGVYLSWYHVVLQIVSELFTGLNVSICRMRIGCVRDSSTRL